MSQDKISIKLFATEHTKEPLESYIPVFHQWIRDGAVEGELLIDVSDYTHVPRGIGVLLVGHGVDVAVDEGEGRPGLLFVRKRGLGAGKDSVDDALSHLLAAADKIDGDSAVHGPRKFGRSEILFRFPDRLSVQNDDASFQKVAPRVVLALEKRVPGVKFALSREGELREPLTIRAKA